MSFSEKKSNNGKRTIGPRPETVEKYRKAVTLYSTTSMPSADICRVCGVTVSGFQAHINKYHRHLLLARNGIPCKQEDAASIQLTSFRRQKPATHAKYKEAIEACDSMEHIAMNISQIAREFGLNGTNLGRQLRTHYPEILERREQARQRLGLNDNLPRGSRRFCKEQYAKAVERLKENPYITIQEAAELFQVSYSGLNQHLLFYHKELVDKRIKIRKKATKEQRKGKITGRGTLHAPTPETEKKYAQALQLYRTTPMSAARIAQETNVPKKGFYAYLQKWHKELICERKNIPYEEGVPVDWSKTRKYNPATAAKYAEAIRKLKESGLPTAAIAAEFGLHPDAFRCYLKEHEPELHSQLGMVKNSNGKSVSQRSLDKYKEAIHLYRTTSEPLHSIARRCGLNKCSFRDFLKRHYPELMEQKKNQKPTS